MIVTRLYSISRISLKLSFRGEDKGKNNQDDIFSCHFHSTQTMRLKLKPVDSIFNDNFPLIGVISLCSLFCFLVENKRPRVQH